AAAVGRHRGRTDAAVAELAGELTDAGGHQLVVTRRLEEHVVTAGDFGLIQEAGEAVRLAGGEVGAPRHEGGVVLQANVVDADLLRRFAVTPFGDRRRAPGKRQAEAEQRWRSERFVMATLS